MSRNLSILSKYRTRRNTGIRPTIVKLRKGILGTIRLSTIKGSRTFIHLTTRIGLHLTNIIRRTHRTGNTTMSLLKRCMRGTGPTILRQQRRPINAGSLFLTLTNVSTILDRRCQHIIGTQTGANGRTTMANQSHIVRIYGKGLTTRRVRRKRRRKTRNIRNINGKGMKVLYRTRITRSIRGHTTLRGQRQVRTATVGSIGRRIPIKVKRQRRTARHLTFTIIGTYFILLTHGARNIVRGRLIRLGSVIKRLMSGLTTVNDVHTGRPRRGLILKRKLSMTIRPNKRTTIRVKVTTLRCRTSSRQSPPSLHSVIAILSFTLDECELPIEYRVSPPMATPNSPLLTQGVDRTSS